MSEENKKQMTLSDIVIEMQKLTNQDITFLEAMKDNAMKKAQLFMLIAKKLGDSSPPENRAQRRLREKLEKNQK